MGMHHRCKTNLLNTRLRVTTQHQIITHHLSNYFFPGGGRKATRITLGIAISIWLLAIICAMPAAVGSYIMVVTDNTGSVSVSVCYPFPKHWLNNQYPKVIVMLKFLVLYVIPLTIIGIFYMNMANHLIVSTRNVPGEMQGTQRQVRGAEGGL